MLMGAVRVKARVQHPKVTQRKDRPNSPWIFRYYADVVQPDGSVKVSRRYHEIAPAKATVQLRRSRPKSNATRFWRS